MRLSGGSTLFSRLVVSALNFAVVLVLSALLLACSGAESVLLDVKVSGTIQYTDRVYSAQGFTGTTPLKAVRFATVELVDGITVIDRTQSDQDGHYQLSGQGVELYVRVLSQSDAGIGVLHTVKDHNGSIYAATRTLAVDGESTLDLQMQLDTAVVGAFNILDVMVNSGQFVAELNKTPMPKLTVHWQPGSNQYGTYYCSVRTSRSSCPSGAGIYLLGGSGSGGDSDQFDDDVIMHEYAHYLEDSLKIQDSPGGIHYLTDNDSDLRLAWSEGWGGFFPGAVKHWLSVQAPELLSSTVTLPTSQFIDTFGNFAAISIDMANPDSYYCFSGTGCFTYSSSEVAVANVLNGVMHRFGMQSLWNAVSGYMSTDSPFPASLETFWDGWLSQRQPDADEYAQLYSIFDQRKIYYRADNFEDDNQRLLGKMFSKCISIDCGGQQHFLYRSSSQADIDHVYLSAAEGKQYYIETLDLGNGADTYLRILDSAGNLVFDRSGRAMANDDRPGTVYCYPLENPCKVHNDDLMLSSSLNFIAPRTEIYTVEISTAGNRPSAAGRYGTYTLKISEQQ